MLIGGFVYGERIGAWGAFGGALILAGAWLVIARRA